MNNKFNFPRDYKKGDLVQCIYDDTLGVVTSLNLKELNFLDEIEWITVFGAQKTSRRFEINTISENKPDK